MNRRRFLAALGAAGAAAVSFEGCWAEPRRLAVTRHDLGGRGTTEVRLVQLSDLHLKRFGYFHRRIAAATRAEAPDVVLLTGDTVDRADALPELDAFLSLLDPRTPKYAVLGNWEHWGHVDLGALASLYERHGCRLLVNEGVEHRHRGRPLSLVGVDDSTGGHPDLPAALRGAGEGPRVLLAHSPAYRDELDEAMRTRVPAWADSFPASASRAVAAPELDLMLSGHTHGGQVCIGGWAPVLPPGSGGYVRGWFREGGPPMYVSRGLGTSVLPLRLGAVPEIAVFRMRV